MTLTFIAEDRRIRVLLDLAKTPNTSSSPVEKVEPKDVELEDLKIEQEFERKEGHDRGGDDDYDDTGNDPESSASNSELNKSCSFVKSFSSDRTNGTSLILNDEITSSPVQERSGQDIRFGDPSHPRKHERETTQGTLLITLFLECSINLK